MAHGKFYGEWCAYFKELAEARGFNVDFRDSDNGVGALARKLGAKHNSLSQYLNGVIRPPRKKLAVWATRLNLTHFERARFLDLGLCAWDSPETKIRLAAQAARLTEAEDRLRTLSADVLALTTENAELRAVLAKHGLAFPDPGVKSVQPRIK